MIAQFALRLIVGMSTLWAIMPRRDVTSGFFRIQMLVTLGLGVLAALTVGQFTGGDESGELSTALVTVRWLAVGIAVGSFLGSVTWTLERRTGGTIYAFLILAAALPALLLAVPIPETMNDGVIALMLFSEYSTATMVGGFVTAMLLGHWYLTAPTMSIKPLSRLNYFLGGFVTVRLLLSAAGWIVGRESLAGQTHYLWLTLRWAAGIVGPAVCVIMVHRILRYRNTQSATGVLFVGVILTFIGELSATLLTRELETPF